MNARTAAAGLGRLLSRRLLDRNPVPRSWDHVTKVDPEPAKRLSLLFPLYLDGTDAVEVGGSRGVTAADAIATFDLLRATPTPTLQEPSGPAQVTPETVAAADLLAVPEVLNGDTGALVGELGAAVERVHEAFVPAVLDDAAPWLPGVVRRRLADWGTDVLLGGAAFEAYIVQNPDSAAARESGVGADDVLDAVEARRRAVAAERHLDSEVVYLEYSGTYGGEAALTTLRELDDALGEARLWYGGGVDDATKAAAVRAAGAETVVVGDAFHRVAEAEASLLSAADDAGLAADPEVVREWVGNAYDPETAASYLATQPTTDEPKPRARELAATAVFGWRVAAELADDGTDHRSPARIVADHGRKLSPVVDALKPVLNDEAATAFARDLVATLVAARRDEPDRAPLSTTHLAVPAAEAVQTR
ncbi:MAG: geranylgeranylglyceryl/heptaprenylglyceryl phosphate synthase [Halolamina sp.]